MVKIRVYPALLYFDHNSTTPVDSRVADVMDHANRTLFGNASSIHRAGQNARQALEHARRGIARHLGVQSSEIVLTSGGTEANNLAIRGALAPGMHAITSVIEHPAVHEPFRMLQRKGVAVTYVPVKTNGAVDSSDVLDAIRPETRFISLMTANNETGAIQPVSEIAEAIRGKGIIMHSDGVQAVGKSPLDLSRIDLFAISGHKFYTPKGLGILYVRKGVELKPLHLGGRHERGLRAGTENVAGALALEYALGLCSLDEQEQITQIRDEFEWRLLREHPEVRVNASGARRLGNTSNVFFPGISGEALLIALDMQGMCVSTGSACSSGSVEPSHVLIQMGMSAKEARSCIRFSFGRGNKIGDVEQLVAALVGVLSRNREKQFV